MTPHPAAYGKPLTEEEDMILRLLARGKVAKEIGAFIGVSERRVHQRFDYIRSKLGAETTIQAMHKWTLSVAAFRATATNGIRE